MCREKYDFSLKLIVNLVFLLIICLTLHNPWEDDYLSSFVNSTFLVFGTGLVGSFVWVVGEILRRLRIWSRTVEIRRAGGPLPFGRLRRTERMWGGPGWGETVKQTTKIQSICMLYVRLFLNKVQSSQFHNKQNWHFHSVSDFNFTIIAPNDSYSIITKEQ